MAKITYKIVDGYGEVRELSAMRHGILEIKVENREIGSVTIGKITRNLDNGRVIFKLSELENKQYHPLLTAEAPISLEPFLKHTSEVALGRIGDTVIRRLLERMESAEEKIAALEKDNARFTAEIINKTIF